MASKTPQITNYKTQIPGFLSEDGMSWVFPTIDSINSHGSSMQWTIIVQIIDKDGNFIPIKDEHYTKQIPYYGYHKVNSGIYGGKIRSTKPTIITSGKNIGRKNETNTFTQALRDALSIYNKQLKKSTRIITADIDMYPPMLAQSTLSILSLPIYVQKKYNGVRAISKYYNDNVIMYSRKKNLYPALDYIKKSLMFLSSAPDLYLDGELYKHGVPLQEISGFARNESSHTGDISYVIYDCFIVGNNMKFSQRYKLLESLNINNYDNVCLAPLWICQNIEQVDHAYNKFLEEGYEGAIIRFDCPYEFSYNDRRSKCLVKKKPTKDHEYTIVDYSKDGKGKAAGIIMIICETVDGIRFPVTPALTIDNRKFLADQMDKIEENGHTHFENNWKNKQLIVYFDEESIDKVPLRARTKMEIRNDF